MKSFILLLFILIFSSVSAIAGEDNDLDMIPDTVMSAPPDTSKPPAEPGKAYRLKVYADEALQGNFKRDDLNVPMPYDNYTGWNHRFGLDLRAEIKLYPGISALIADRVNHFSNEDRDINSAQIQNDLKEAYLSWNFFQSDYADIGRINLRNGVALGFNPTDFFKKNAVSTRISEDPGILRENRLGTLMLRCQIIRERGSLTVAAAPEVSDRKEQWWTDRGSAGLALDRTNSDHRFLAKLTMNIRKDFSPELLYYYEKGMNPAFGMNITEGIGDHIIAYFEWSGTKRKNLISAAMQEAEFSGLFPADMTAALSADDEEHFTHQLAVGFSYTEKAVNRTTYLEYHYNQAGFSDSDTDQWFQIGSGAGNLPDDPVSAGLAKAQLGQLWFIRQWAREVQEPLNRHSLFVRTSWEDALAKNLNLVAIADIDLSDGSFFLQPFAEYHFSNHLTFSLTVNLYAGGRESQYGSLQQSGNVKAGITYYF